MNTKYIPKVGEHLYLRQYTGNYWVDSVKTPYTVVKVVDEKFVYVRRCQLVFYGKRYYDTLPDEILDDEYGDVVMLKWSNAKKWGGAWVCKNDTSDTYPRVAVFGEGYQYEPYLN